MANIDKIILTNFKAFYDEQIIDIQGKNLLIYGENGSGKSSIYWALYTLMQSSTKTEDQTYKYFSPNRDENLVNINYVEPQVEIDPSDGARLFPLAEILDSKVEVSLTDGTSFKISYKGVETTDLELLKNLNRFSDFISHRLLINFYNFRNSKEINLWEVFVRDMFPFLKTNRGNNDKTLSDELNEIDNTQPFINLRTDEFQLTSSQRIQNTYNIRISEFNNDVRYWINEINTEVNRFYNTHFKNLEEKEIRISLKYDEPLQFDKNFYQYYKGKKRNYKYVGFNSPHISINIEIKKDDGTYTPIPKPQSYFNEAKLTSIGLAVRFTLLLEFIRPDFDGKFLALDDLLVSLDMSNRDKVLDIILNVFAPKYKIYLFTHERSFFNMVKRRLDYSGLLSNWKIREIYQIPESGINSPKDFPSNSFFAQAQYHKNSKPPDYPASVNYLRKELEEILKTFLPKEIFKNNDGTNKDKLNDKIIATKYLFNRLKIDLEIINQIDDYIFLLLNPLSHSDLESEIYKTDIEKIFNLLTTFRQDCETLKPLIKKVLPRATKIKMVLNKNATTANEYLISIEEDVFIYSPPSGNGIFSDSELNKEIICYEIVNSIKGENFNLSLNKEQKESMQKFYEQTCHREGVAVNANYLDHFEKLDGTKLNTFI